MSLDAAFEPRRVLDFAATLSNEHLRNEIARSAVAAGASPDDSWLAFLSSGKNGALSTLVSLGANPDAAFSIDVNPPPSEPQNLRSPLAFAVERRDAALVDELLSLGASPFNLDWASGYSALRVPEGASSILWMCSQSFDCGKLLLDRFDFPRADLLALLSCDLDQTHLASQLIPLLLDRGLSIAEALPDSEAKSMGRRIRPAASFVSPVDPAETPGKSLFDAMLFDLSKGDLGRLNTLFFVAERETSKLLFERRADFLNALFSTVAMTPSSSSSSILNDWRLFRSAKNAPSFFAESLVSVAKRLAFSELSPDLVHGASLTVGALCEKALHICPDAFPNELREILRNHDFSPSALRAFLERLEISEHVDAVVSRERPRL